MIVERYRLTLTHTLIDDTERPQINLEQPLIAEYNFVPTDNMGHPVFVNHVINRLCEQIKEAVCKERKEE